MTRCEAFYNKCKQFLDSEKTEELEKFCKKESEWTVWSIKRYIEFCTNYSLALAHVSERALRPLIALEGTPHEDKIPVVATLLNQIPSPTQDDVDSLIKSTIGLLSEKEKRAAKKERYQRSLEEEIRKCQHIRALDVVLQKFLVALAKSRESLDAEGLPLLSAEMSNLMSNAEILEKRIAASLELQESLKTSDNTF